MRKATIFIISVILACGFIFYRYIRTTGELPYELITIQKGNLVQKVLATGTINPVVTVQIGSQASGTIKEIYVDYNSRVKKGQLLALIDPDAFKAQLTQAEASLDSAKANFVRQEATLLYSKALLEKSDVQLKEAKLHVERIRELFNKGLAPRIELDSAEASYDTAVAQKKAQEAQYNAELQAVNVAKAQVTQWEGAVKLAKVNLEHAKIKSPIDGIVISRNVDFGQTVITGFQALTLFIIADDLTKMEVNTSVSEANIGNVKLNQEVIFKVDAYPERIFSGKVKEIRMSPNIEQKVVTYSVITSVDNKEMLLRPGMTADVWIKTASKEDVILIPAAAVKEKEGKKYVEVLEGKEIKKRGVEAGLKGTDGFIEILSGLNEGEKVVISNRGK